MASPISSSGDLAGKRPDLDLSPQSACSSPSLSRLTYISMNDATVAPTPERKKVPIISLYKKNVLIEVINDVRIN